MKSGELLYTLDELNKAVQLFRECMNYCSVFTLQGDLGAGKTTLLKALLKELGVTDTIMSPTYAYMCKYRNKQGATFYHFDLYRMKTASDFFDMGFNELIYQPNTWSFIEWPEIIMPFLKGPIAAISLEHSSETTRTFRYTIIDL